TGLIGTIHMRITWFTTLMTMRYYIIRNSLCSSLIENKILSDKFIFKFFFLYLANIIDNSSFKLEHLLKPSMLIVCTCLLTSYPSGTIHHKILIFLMHL